MSSLEHLSTGKCLDGKTLTWKIENFEDIRRSKELILSQSITIHMGDKCDIPTEWSCYLSTKSEENALTSIYSVGVFISLRKAFYINRKDIYSFQLGIKTKNISVDTGVKTFFMDGKIFDIWGWPSLIPAETNSEKILNNGCLYLELDLKLFSTAEIPLALPVDVVEKQYRLKFSEKLCQDFGKLLSETLKVGFCETTIISKDAVEFNVNRDVLSARSPVFEKMFHNDKEVSKTDIILIRELHSETIRVLLHFVYTGMLQNEWKSPSVLPELVDAANKYQLPDLLAFLDKTAGKVCCRENVGRLVGQARKLGLKRAENELECFIKQNITSLYDRISFA